MARELLSDDESGSDLGGVEVEEDFQVNQEFAQRFEYNKKREELQKLEEKHGNSTRKRKRDSEADVTEDDSSSSSEDEDDVGELATENLDSEISATLKAIRSKDPRVYDTSATFYSAFDEAGAPIKEKKEKAMYLKDYHRENLLKGGQAVAEEPLSYNQQQEELKHSIVGQMHAAVESDEDSSDQSESGFLTKKVKQPVPKAEVVLDVENAEKDPETFLSNFMAARAWVPTESSALQPFESDDEEEEKRADNFEEAYNLRFEDPVKSNEKLKTHARDIASQYSVRRDDTNMRKKKRELEKERKEAAKQELKEEKARLKKLRIEEVEEKVKKIKRAAGLKGSDLQPEDWAHFVDDDWDDDKWEQEMQRRFGDSYYAKEDVPSDQEEGVQKKKVKKPKFDDDIDIRDIVPDFDEEEDAQFSASDEEKVSNKKKKHKQVKEDKKRDAKRERRIIEQLVDDQLQLELNSSIPNASKTKGFRYRETSPQSFGLTSRDILLADDIQLNEFAGLKKLAAFRPEDKKEKDQKRLGKKARLRKWRQDTFGNEEGLQDVELVPQASDGNALEVDREEGGVDIKTSGKKKRRRGKKQKTNTDAEA